VSDPASRGVDDQVRELSGSRLDVGVDVWSSGMMRPTADVKVYLHREPIDMRRYAPTKVMRSSWWPVGIPQEVGAISTLHNGMHLLAP
jgi:hypothetical protein